ncbi:hypothetical protein ONZ45_g4160 [Pleurotus djamor]|nr:hypothetical protein ONZ45_g4160 [Pleurotus djamor]
MPSPHSSKLLQDTKDDGKLQSNTSTSSTSANKPTTTSSQGAPAPHGKPSPESNPPVEKNLAKPPILTDSEAHSTSTEKEASAKPTPGKTTSTSSSALHGAEDINDDSHLDTTSQPLKTILQETIKKQFIKGEYEASKVKISEVTQEHVHAMGLMHDNTKTISKAKFKQGVQNIQASQVSEFLGRMLREKQRYITDIEECYQLLNKTINLKPEASARIYIDQFILGTLSLSIGFETAFVGLLPELTLTPHGTCLPFVRSKTLTTSASTRIFVSGKTDYVLCSIEDMKLLDAKAKTWTELSKVISDNYQVKIQILIIEAKNREESIGDHLAQMRTEVMVAYASLLAS